VHSCNIYTSYLYGLEAIELSSQVQAMNYLLTSGFISRSFNPIHDSSFTFSIIFNRYQTSIINSVTPIGCGIVRKMTNLGAYLVAAITHRLAQCERRGLVLVPTFKDSHASEPSFPRTYSFLSSRLY